jgi:predicted DNA-binding transcriptional regulator YafY
VTDEEIKKELFTIYCLSGADPDGNETFHCTVEQAFFSTRVAVGYLRDEYNEALDEIVEVSVRDAQEIVSFVMSHVGDDRNIVFPDELYERIIKKIKKARD